jgi:hypothetical protein
MVLATLSTVAPVHRIRKIMIDLGRDEIYSGYQDIDLGGKTGCELLDSKLSTLPLCDPPSVEFEVHLGSSEHEAAKEFFPGLTSQDTVRFYFIHIVCLYLMPSPSSFVSLSGAKRCLIPGGRYVPTLSHGQIISFLCVRRSRIWSRSCDGFWYRYMCSIVVILLFRTVYPHLEPCLYTLFLPSPCILSPKGRIIFAALATQSGFQCSRCGTFILSVLPKGTKYPTP